MSDRMTGVSAPGTGITGLDLWGRKSRSEAIAAWRAMHQRKLEDAQRALAIPDDQLYVSTFLGPYARRNEQEVTE